MATRSRHERARDPLPEKVKDFTRFPAYRKEIRIDASQEEVLNRFQHLPLDFEPGERHRNSNSGYFPLGVVIEKTSGKSFEEFAEERLLRPLEFERTFCDSPTRIIPDRAFSFGREEHSAAQLARYRIILWPHQIPSSDIALELVGSRRVPCA